MECVQDGPRSLSNLEAWYEVFGRADDNVEAMKLRFDTFKAETLPTVKLFRSKGKCVDIDTSQGRETVYSLLRDQLAQYTDPRLIAQPLTEKAEILLGLKPYPKKA